MAIKINKLIRSRRRSISIEITRAGQLVVRMPRYGSVEAVKRFIAEKRDWIEKKLVKRTRAPEKTLRGNLFQESNFIIWVKSIRYGWWKCIIPN